MLYEIVKKKKKPGVQSIGRSFASETTTCRPPAPAPRTLRTHERPRLRPAPHARGARRPSLQPPGRRARPRTASEPRGARHPARLQGAFDRARATPRPPRSRRLRARTYGGKKKTRKKGKSATRRGICHGMACQPPPLHTATAAARVNSWKRTQP